MKNGNLTNVAIEDGPFIPDLPMKSVIFYSYVSLPEGNVVKAMPQTMP